jgi:predicted CXXCH cytochrome family protein
MKSFLSLMFAVLLLARAAVPQSNTTDVLGMHNLTPSSGASIYTQPGSIGCTFCHAPHSGLGGISPLWNQTYSQATYVPYGSTTYHETGNTKPTLGVTSSLCLSCHDGTVAMGQTAVFGQIQTTGKWAPGDTFGTTLSGTHPFSLVLPMKDASNLVASLVSQGKTGDPTGKVKLVHGNIECTSCHDPHVQNNDRIAQQFLVKDSSSGQMCLACHDPNRTMQGQVNPLAGWNNSIHQSATNQVAGEAHVGSYSTVALNACTSCHMDHNATSPARLMRPATPAAPGVDATTQDCMTCHQGGTYLSPVPPNIMAEIAKTGHPLPAGVNSHDAAEPGVLFNNRHATCTDCHSAHASNKTTVFGPPPALRPSQAGVMGISATDGITVLNPAVNQYENCLRCHGTGPGKQRLLIYGYSPIRLVSQPDSLNVIPEFAALASSSHPVTHDRSSGLSQPSLRNYMLNQNGSPSPRSTGPRIFCSDCHSSDDNREFGGAGPNGPHGSVNSHILERNYQFSQAAVPGGLVTNLFPNPDQSMNGPYSMCAKCHDLTQILANTSWNKHNSHVGQDGFTCSVCHTAHGMGANSSQISGERLVNFDANVVGLNNAAPISYSRAKNTCTLLCHQVAHNADGSVTRMNSPGLKPLRPR